MALRKLREFVRDGHRRVSKRWEPNVLEEEVDDKDITDATTLQFPGSCRRANASG